MTLAISTFLLRDLILLLHLVLFLFVLLGFFMLMRITKNRDTMKGDARVLAIIGVIGTVLAIVSWSGLVENAGILIAITGLWGAYFTVKRSDACLGKGLDEGHSKERSSKTP